jgi:tetratricopeptide (TPR) repeat protein
VDYVCRYLRTLVFGGLNSASAAALALGEGVLAFVYTRADMARVFPDWIGEDNVRRDCKRLWTELNDRFAGVITPTPRIHKNDPYDFVRAVLRSPDEDYRLFLEFARVAAPWSVAPYPSDDDAYLAFGADGGRRLQGAPGNRHWTDHEWRRFRALVERFPGVVCSHNRNATEPVEDPAKMLQFPRITGGSPDGDPHARFREPVLTGSDREFLLNRRSERERRDALREPQLIVYINGAQRAVLHSPKDWGVIRARGGRGLLQVFAVDRGQDTAPSQELLIAAVPLDEVHSDSGGRRYRVRVPVNRSLTLLIELTPMPAAAADDEPELAINAWLAPPAAIPVAAGRPVVRWAVAAVSVAALLSAGYLGVRLQQQTEELESARLTLQEQAVQLATREWSDEMARTVAARLQSAARIEAETRLTRLHDVLAARLRSGSFESLMTLGNAFLYGGDLTTARRVFERAKAIRGSEVEPYNSLGAIMYLQGRPDEAVAELRQATGAWPENPRVHVYLAWYLEAVGDRAGARRELNLAIDLKRDYADAHYNVGLLEELDGRRDEAARHFDVARSLLLDQLAARPEDGELHFQLAKVLAARGEDADAAEHLQRAVRIDADWAFWGRREDAFADLFRARPELREVLDAVAMVPVVERIRAAMDGQI